MPFDPAIYNKELEDGIVPDRDFEVYIYKNIITEEHKDIIYSQINESNIEFLVQDFAGHKAWMIHNSELEKYLTVWISNLLGEQMILGELSFARYSNEYGYKPKLFPHFDTHDQDGQRITLDIQLNSTTPWAIVVEEEPFVLDNNDGLVFAGTQQVHWRENKTLSNEDKVDMLFAHFKYADNRPWGKDQKLILEYWSHRFREKTGIERQPIPLNSKEKNEL
jgi:hypothetical protein